MTFKCLFLGKNLWNCCLARKIFDWFTRKLTWPHTVKHAVAPILLNSTIRTMEKNQFLFLVRILLTLGTKELVRKQWVLVPLEQCTQTKCLINTRNDSTWLFFQKICQLIRGDWSTWPNFWENKPLSTRETCLTNDFSCENESAERTKEPHLWSLESVFA